MKRARTIGYFLAACFCVCIAAVMALLQPIRSLSSDGTRASARNVTAPSSEAGSLIRPSSSNLEVANRYQRLPLAFEPGPASTSDPTPTFVARGIGYAVSLAPTEMVLALRNHDKRSDFVHMQLVGANKAPKLIPLDELPGKSNYLHGSQRQYWRVNVPNYRKVSADAVYPGIDVVYYGNQRNLEYDFIIAPGADPQLIDFAFEGVQNLRIDPREGDLIVSLRAGEVRMHRPVAFQESNGVKHPVAAGYVLQSKHSVSFELAAYDKNQTLIVDPTLAYSTYLGGINIDGANAIAVASDATAFIAGGTFSLDFPTAHPLQANHGGGDDFFKDAFVSKISADGSALLYSTYLGGENEDVANGIAVDTFGDAYITGTTLSPHFPVTPGAFNTLCGGDGQCGASYNNGFIVSGAFVTKLNPAGSGIVYSGILGGDENVRGQSIAVDSDQNAYVTGQTEQNGVPVPTPLIPPPPFPITGNAFQPAYGGGATDVFVTKISATGSTIAYSSYAGGANEDIGYGISVDTAAVAYVTGLTYSTNFPTVGAVPQGASGGAGDAFAIKVNTRAPGIGSLVYSTYLGGSGLDQGNGIAVDSAGNAYVAGATASTSFVFTPTGFQTTNHGQGDAFVAKLTPTGALTYFTYLGGTLADTAAGIAADSTGNAYVTGSTVSSDFPVTTPVFQHIYGGGNADAFVAKLNPTGTVLVYSSFLGGTNTELAGGIAVDAVGSAYVAGQTCSQDFPLSNPLQASYAGDCDAYVAKVSVLGGMAISPAGLVFPAQSIGTTSGPLVLTLTNTNDVAPVSFTGLSLAGTNPGDFVQTNTCNGSLAAGAQCSVTVTFHPNATGIRKASIAIADNAPGSPQVVSLNGSTSTVTLSTSSLSFGTQQVGLTSTPQTVTATNNGTVPLAFTGISASSDFLESNSCAVPLQPLTSCVISVTFHPLAAGTSSGALVLNDNGSGSPQIVLLNGSGFVQNPDFTLSALSGSATITAGQAGSLTMMLSPLGGFSQPVSLSCSGLPQGAACSVSPNPANLSGTAPLTLTVNLTTAVRTVVPPFGRKLGPFDGIRSMPRAWTISLLAFVMLALIAGVRRQPARTALCAAVVLMILSAACSGGTSAGVPSGTAAGSYPVSVTGTSGSISRSTGFTLNIK